MDYAESIWHELPIPVQYIYKLAVAYYIILDGELYILVDNASHSERK